MDKFISFYYGYRSDYHRRIQLIQDAGFNGVMALYRFTETFYEECGAILKAGLKIDSIHLPFKGVNNIWRSEEKCASFMQAIKEGIQYASDMKIDKVTIHSSATLHPPKKNSNGIMRIRELTHFAESKNVQICLENLRRPDYFHCCFEEPNVRLNVCYDSGHDNAFWKKEKFDFDRYKSRILCCHLHDNGGFFDSHLLPFQGEIDWEQTARNLKKCQNLSGLTLEVGLGGGHEKKVTEEVFINNGYQSLLVLDKMMEKE